MKSEYKILVSYLDPRNASLWPKFEKLIRNVITIVETKPDLDPVLELKLGFHKYLIIEVEKGKENNDEVVTANLFRILDELFEAPNWHGFLEEVVEEIKKMRLAQKSESDIVSMLRQGLLLLYRFGKKPN